MRPTYTARVERSGDWWVIDVVGLRGVFSQARRLRLVEYMARDAISLMLEVPEDSFDVEVVVDLEPELDRLVRTAVDARQKADEAEREASTLMRTASTELLAAGLTFRDVGRLLGVSHQRIAQLAPGRSTRTRTAASSAGAKSPPMAAAHRG